MKKREVIDKVNYLNNLVSTKQPLGIKISYAVNRNIDKLLPEAKAIEESYKALPKHSDEYLKKLDIINKDFAKKDEKDQPIRHPRSQESFIIDEKRGAEYKKALETLDSEYKEEVEKYNQEVENLQDLLEEEVDLNIHKVDIECFQDIEKFYETKKEITELQLVMTFLNFMIK